MAPAALLTVALGAMNCGGTADDEVDGAQTADDDGKSDRARGSGGSFRGFPPATPPNRDDWWEERNEIWLGSDGASRRATVVVRERGGGIGNVLGPLLTGNEHRSSGIIGDLVTKLGGSRDAARAGVRVHRTFGNLFGARGTEYAIDVDVDQRLTAADYAGLSRDTHLVMPLASTIVDALRARGGDPVKSLTGGLAVWTWNRGVYLKVDKSGVVDFRLR